MSDRLLVTGASGHLGQRVLAHLLDTLQVPASRLIVTTRNPDRLAALAERGVTIRAADFDDAVSLAAAFQGASRLLLISTDAVDSPGRRLTQHRQAVAAAVKAGVQHVIYTSMPRPEQSPLLLAPDHAGTEQALTESTLPGWTVLRNHWYFENLFFTLPSVLASGHWYSAAGEGRLANIARDDLARAAAVALSSDQTGKQVYTLSGPEALTTSQIAELVGQAIGKSIQVVPVPVEGLVQGMVGAGLPQGLAEVFASFDTNTAAGRVAEVTDDYRRLTGLAPQSFADWLVTNRAALAAL